MPRPQKISTTLISPSENAFTPQKGKMSFAPSDATGGGVAAEGMSITAEYYFFMVENACENAGIMKWRCILSRERS